LIESLTLPFSTSPPGLDETLQKFVFFVERSPRIKSSLRNKQHAEQSNQQKEERERGKKSLFSNKKAIVEKIFTKK
jgi:hypothetical protein